MIRKGTWILLGVFVVVLLAASVWQFTPLKERVITATPTPTVQLNTSVEFFPGLISTSVANVKIQSADGAVVQVTRGADGLWAVTQPAGGEADQTSAEALVSSVITMRTVTEMNPQDDLTVYGLAQPAYFIQFSVDGGDSHIINVGDAAPTGSAYYVTVDGGRPQAVAKYDLDAILSFLTDPPLQPTPTPEVTPPAETLAPTPAP